ncbi:hypothetical protein J5893_05155 [bacterium]|nr:hypothetical protein [bacterium]
MSKIQWSDAINALVHRDSFSSPLVAVIDLGVNYTHPDLANQMWDGSDCIAPVGVPR